MTGAGAHEPTPENRERGGLRRLYGDEPRHLVVSLVSFTVIAAGIAGWLQPGSDPHAILIWMVCCALAVDLVMLPLAWALDRFAVLAARDSADARVRSASMHVRIPGMLSLLLLVVFAPLIFRADTTSFRKITGLAPPDYLLRWLLATAAMYAVSLVWYFARLALRRRSH